MNDDPIIVLGIPRSGTSTIARILAEQMNFLMALEYAPPDWRNPGGFYEDINLAGLNEVVISRYREKRIYYPEWRRSFCQYMNCLHGEAIKQDKNWGIKETRSTFPLIWATLIEQYSDPIFVWCKRDRDLIIPSLQKCFDYPEDAAVMLYDNRTIADERFLRYRNPIIIDYGKNRLTDDEIRNTLIEGLHERKIGLVERRAAT